MISRKRQLRKREQLERFSTEEVLIQSLNGDGSLSAKTRERLASLIAMIQSAESLDAESANERESILERLEKTLLRYRWSPKFESGSHESSLNPAFSYHAKTLEEQHENWCVWWITELVRQRNILRVRPCVECGRWLWAVRDHQRHCSDTCRKKHASHNPTFKEKRRLYMRKHRQDEKVRSAAMLARVRKSNTR
jgi:hypothetical protein